jgi:hypothetical protein
MSRSSKPRRPAICSHPPAASVPLAPRGTSGERAEERGAFKIIAFIAVLLCLCPLAKAQVTYTGTTDADAYLATGSPDNPAGTDLTGLNFGAAGILVIAPAASLKGEFQSVIRFNLSNAVTLFNTSLGANNWTMTNISLQLTSNYGAAGEQPDNLIFNVINGGNFVIEWLSNDNWVEGTGRPKQPTTDGVTYDSLPTLLSGTDVNLCTNTYVPPGDNVPVTWTLPLNANLVANVTSGGEVTLLFYAADNQINYLFNSREFGGTNAPYIKVTAVAPLTILSASFTGGVFHLSATGADNTDYEIQANADLTTTNWQTLGTVTADATGSIQFDDLSATNSQCFYRLTQAPSM